MQLHDVSSSRTDAAMRTRAAWDFIRALSFRDAHLQVGVARLDCDRSILLFSFCILISFCIPLAMCGCLGGQIIGANASAGSLQASPNNVNFGSVSLGTTTSASVALVNQGTADVKVSQVSLAGQSFSVTGANDLPITVSAGRTVNLNVNFSPATMGTATGQLTISSDGAANGTLVVGLNGTGTATETATAPQLSLLSCNNNTVTGSAYDTCTVTLNEAAPSGGIAVSLASNDPAVTTPASITVGSGSTSASFMGTISAVPITQTATLTASAGGAAETFALQLDAASQASAGTAVLSGLSCANSSVTGAGTDSCTIALNGAAGSGGITVSLASDNNEVTVPASVTVASGSTSASFTANIASVNSTQVATLTADAGGVTEAFALQLNAVSGPAASAPVLTGMSCAIVSMTGAGTDACSVLLNSAAPSGGFSVNLASSNLAVTVPTSVTVTAGSTSASFIATFSSVSSAQTVTLTASSGGVVEEFSMQLNVSGTSGLSINATSIAFGNVPLNTMVTQTVQLTASGPLPILVAAATVQGSGFSIAGATFPLTLAIGQPVLIDVTFDPTSAGAATGQLIIVSTALTGGTATVSLSGSGEVSEVDEVNLSWDAPESSPDPVAGYNIYRAPGGSASYAQLNPAVVTETTYVDTTVQASQTYDYIVESVDALGVASAPSNMASVTIP